MVVETVHVLPKEEQLKCSIFEMEIPTGYKSYKTSTTFFYFTGSFWKQKLAKLNAWL